MLKTLDVAPGLPMSLIQCQKVFKTCYFIFTPWQLGDILSVRNIAENIVENPLNCRLCCS